jgi:nitrite reductase (cytochrome c-552)
MAPSPTGYGGGRGLRQTRNATRNLLTSYAGSAFAKEYQGGQVRTSFPGRDLLGVAKRVTDKPPGSCITCKTPAVGKIFAEQGWDYREEEDGPNSPAMNLGPVGCASCHDPRL